jgi:hypothetical protein
MMALLVTVLLLTFTSPARGEWVEYVKFRNGDTFYYDPASIKRDGHLRRVWAIENLEQREKYGALSYRLRWEFDCKKERVRYLSFATFSERMARGTVLASRNSEDAWGDIAPGSAAAIMRKALCR